MPEFNPPGFPTFTAATPSDVETIRFLGRGHVFEGVSFTTDQAQSIYRLYGFNITLTPTTFPERAPDPGPKPQFFFPTREEEEQVRAWEEAHRQWVETDPKRIQEAHDFFMEGNKLHAARRAERDGLRAMALLAKFVEPGTDPVRFLASLLQEAGCDLQTGWEEDDDEDDEF